MEKTTQFAQIASIMGDFLIQPPSPHYYTMGKMDELCQKINATFCLLRKLEMNELSENPFYQLCPIRRKGGKYFFI